MTFSDSAITEITIDKAENSDESSDGSIVIITEDGEMIIKNIKRCLPETCVYETTYPTQTISGITLDACTLTGTVDVSYVKIAPGREESECPNLSGTSSYTFNLSDFGVSTNENNYPVSGTITVEDNVTIEYTQEAGPCHGCVEVSKTYKYDDKEIDCVSAETLTLSCEYTCTTIYSNCDEKIERGENSITLSNITCNSGGNRQVEGYEENVTGSTLAAAHPKITQLGNCECEQPSPCENKTITVTPSKSTIDCSGETITFTATIITNE